ncbi:MAG: hypothetical protein K8F35_03315 [Dokdonella sp.]|uniref:hypothetical protein n=1 Tax=Dokdonella sp. TaxID=2291710 RepID=UPI0025BE5E7D|nr:hypothetical protein [Dokdonella sp.]MBZ0222036.1 hypothetical protein [Dokdonella sp.]
MKNITIGRAGSDWAPAAAARYYAQRGDGEEYAFGPTPAEALARLQAREAAGVANFDKSLAEEVAFLALGAANVLRDQPSVKLDAFGGYMGFIGEVIRHAPLLAAYWKRMGDDGFDGVWLYDVTERFGREWAEGLIAGSTQCPTAHLECIIRDELEKWA